MKVTIENYTEHCLKTWGGENQKKRAELGIVGELGEVAEVLKKYLRGDFDEVERDKRLLKELGDLLYYIAIDMYLWDMDFSEYFKFNLPYIKKIKFVTLSTKVIEYVNNDIIDAYFLSDAFHRFCRCNGFTLEQVMQANIEKLSKRAKNGLIQGDGSNRGE